MTHSFAGASLRFWLLFHATIAALLLVDLLVVSRGSERADHRAFGVRNAWAWTAVLAAIAFTFSLFISREQGHGRAIEFVSGYLVEGSLSIDNLFVFLLLFRSLGLSIAMQRRVLLWGLLGAIVLRGGCIFTGVALLDRFSWVQYVFGVVLLLAGVRLLRHTGRGEEQQPAPIRWLRQRMRSDGALEGSALLFVILAVECTDLLFALDSIPAVFAITRDAFIVYTSNIFAVLGLRSLYFALAGVLDKLRLLHYGLAVILIFVAGKMLAARWIEVPASVSLLIIVFILAAFAIASKLMPGPVQAS